MVVSRRQLVRRLGAGGLAGLAAGVAGCGSDSEDVSIVFVGIRDTVVGITVRVSLSNETDETIEALARAEVSVGEGENAETHRGSTRADLPPRENTGVDVVIDEGQLMRETEDASVDGEAWAEFPSSEREQLDPRECDECPDGR